MRNWNSFEELFLTLNTSDVLYVILRNFEMLTEEALIQGHEDIDFLCDDPNKLNDILGSSPRGLDTRDKVHRFIILNASKVPVDVRYIGDGYYDKTWELKILNDRILHNNLFYIPSKCVYYYSLCYHGYIQKQYLSADYLEKLDEMKTNLNIDNTITHLELLWNFMKINQYKVTISNAGSAYINLKIVPGDLIERNICIRLERLIYRTLRKIKLFVKEK